MYFLVILTHEEINMTVDWVRVGVRGGLPNSHTPKLPNSQTHKLTNSQAGLGQDWLGWAGRGWAGLLEFCVFQADFNQQICRNLNWRPQAQFRCISMWFSHGHLQETGLVAASLISMRILVIVTWKSAGNVAGGVMHHFLVFHIDLIKKSSWLWTGGLRLNFYVFPFDFNK